MSNPDWIPKPIRWIINRIDDPFDNLKHYLHGLEICLWGRIYKVRVYMSNNPGWTGIRRVDEHDPNANNTIRIRCKHGN